ncbi:MAG: hypothetical protein ACXVJD_00340 [Mucilaginibacter sp.]
MKFSLIFLSVLLFIPNLLPFHLISVPSSPVKKELFDPVLAKKLQSAGELESYIDSVQNVRRIKSGSVQYADLISNVIRNRFYHCYSHYSLSQNWIAAFCGRFIWYDLSAIVIPDDVLKYPMGACSQQSIILMDFFKRKHIEFRKIAFDHHFAMEGNFNNKWIYFDPDMEPQYPQGFRPGLAYLLKDNHLELLYKGVIPADYIHVMLGHPKAGKINEYPASKVKFFHIVTGFLSHWLWILPLSILLFPLIKRFRHTT